jgi:hypothetical protein
MVSISTQFEAFKVAKSACAAALRLPAFARLGTKPSFASGPPDQTERH